MKCKRASTQLQDIPSGSDIIIIATSDQAIAEVATGLATQKHLRFKKLFIAHTSGVYSSGVLKPLARKGATVASLHPIQTFPSNQRLPQLRNKLRGIYFGIEGDAEGISLAERIVKDLEGNSIVISKELKPLYHVICVFASGYFMVFLNTISELTRLLNIKASWTEVFGPLMTTAMENTVRNSAANALTGPILRADFSTVHLHLDALSQSAPQFLPLYTTAGIESARIAKNSGKITREDYNHLISQFKKFIRTATFKQPRKVTR